MMLVQLLPEGCVVSSGDPACTSVSQSGLAGSWHAACPSGEAFADSPGVPRYRQSGPVNLSRGGDVLRQGHLASASLAWQGLVCNTAVQRTLAFDVGP